MIQFAFLAPRVRGVLSTCIAAVTLLVGVCVAGPAVAQTAPGMFVPQSNGFGTRDQVVLTTETNFGLAIDSVENEQTSTTLVVAPSADYFVAPSLSLGGLLDVTYVHNPNATNRNRTTITLAPRVGYAVPLGAQVSLWGRAGVGFTHMTVNNGVTEFPFLMDVRVLFHLSPRFFIGMGPVVSVDLATANGAPHRNQFALDFLIGGTF